MTKKSVPPQEDRQNEVELADDFGSASHEDLYPASTVVEEDEEEKTKAKDAHEEFFEDYPFAD